MADNKDVSKEDYGFIDWLTGAPKPAATPVPQPKVKQNVESSDEEMLNRMMKGQR